MYMKKILLCCFVIILGLSSCSLLNKMGIGGSKSGKQDGGCPTNGKNVGAEKLMSSDGKVIKTPKYTKGKGISY